MIDQPVSKFMNPNVLHGPTDTAVREIIDRMHAAGLGAFVVCEKGVPVGIVTEQDAIALLHSAFEGDLDHATLASEIMTSPVQTLSDAASMESVLTLLRKNSFRRVPIVDSENQLTGIVEMSDLQAALNAALERRGRDLEVAVMRRTAELQAANAALEKKSVSDGLTGLLNRRALSARLAESLDLCRRYGSLFSIILVDIDHFKKYNDALGHVAGDHALKEIARILTDTVRGVDSVFRYGGEEFLISLPETDSGGMVQVAERIRSAVEAAGIPHPESNTASVVTLSLGHTTVTKENVASFESWMEIVEKADQALYEAKSRGRNQSVQAV